MIDFIITAAIIVIAVILIVIAVSFAFVLILDWNDNAKMRRFSDRWDKMSQAERDQATKEHYK